VERKHWPIKFIKYSGKNKICAIEFKIKESNHVWEGIQLNHKNNKLIFDTLTYANQLKTAGIKNSNLCTKALNDALALNIYSKPEIDKMIQSALNRVDASLRRFDERTKELKQESIADRTSFEKSMAADRITLEKAMAADRITLEKAMAADRIAFEKAMEKDRLAHQKEIGSVTDKLNNAIEKLNEKIMESNNRTITLLGTIIVITGAIATFAHHLM
jgi:hypothetical protein